MARPVRFELPTPWFVAGYPINYKPNHHFWISAYGWYLPVITSSWTSAFSIKRTLGLIALNVRYPVKADIKKFTFYIPNRVFLSASIPFYQYLGNINLMLNSFKNDALYSYIANKRAILAHYIRKINDHSCGRLSTS